MFCARCQKRISNNDRTTAEPAGGDEPPPLAAAFGCGLGNLSRSGGCLRRLRRRSLTLFVLRVHAESESAKSFPQSVTLVWMWVGVPARYSQLSAGETPSRIRINAPAMSFADFLSHCRLVGPIHGRRVCGRRLDITASLFAVAGVFGHGGPTTRSSCGFGRVLALPPVFLCVSASEFRAYWFVKMPEHAVFGHGPGCAGFRETVNFTEMVHSRLVRFGCVGRL